MTVLSADQFPGVEHQPLAYPGLRPDFSYVYYQGKVYEITPRGDTYADLQVDDSAAEVTLDAFLAARGNATMGQRHAVLAVGSNGCPGRLAEKYGHQPDVALPVFVGTLVNTAVVYSRQFAAYGALPATYLYQPGAVSWLSVTMLTDEQLARMDETEAVGEFYLRIPVPGYFRVEGGPDVDSGPMIGDLTAYLDRKILTYHGKPVRLKMFAREDADWPFMDERKVLSLVFDQAGLLLGEPIEKRYRQLLADEPLRLQLVKFLDTRMSALAVDKQGQLVERARPSITCTRVIRTDTRPGSEGTYIVRLSQANRRRLKVGSGAYLKVRYGNASVMARLSVDNELKDAEIRMDETLRTAISLEPIMQGSGKKELICDPDDDGALRYPIAIQRSKFRGPGLITRLLKQQYLICLVHHAMGTDMETPLARLTMRAVQVLGIQPGDKVFLISEKRRKSLRCLPLNPKFQLPSETMKTEFADWECPLPDDEDLRLPWMTLDLQTRRALGVQPWQPIIVGRDPYHALASEFGAVALALALAALGGAIVVDVRLGQLAILLIAIFVVFVLIWLKIRSRI